MNTDTLDKKLVRFIREQAELGNLSKYECYDTPENLGNMFKMLELFQLVSERVGYLLEDEDTFNIESMILKKILVNRIKDNNLYITINKAGENSDRTLKLLDTDEPNEIHFMDPHSKDVEGDFDTVTITLHT